MTVMIGVDPHKRSHTAVAIDRRRGGARRDRGARVGPPGRGAARRGRPRFERSDVGGRVGAAVLGYLLAQQLVARG